MSAQEISDATAPDPSSKQPSLLNIKSMPVNTEMRVESDVLEPLTFSQSEAVWELQPKGFLHPNSAITIALDVNSAVGRAFPYVGVGIHSIVRRAVLRTTAGRVINDTDDWNVLQATKSLAVLNSVNKEREQFLTGRQVAYEMYYDEGSDVKATDGYGLSNGNEVCLDAKSTQEGMSVRPEILNKAQPEFQLKLHELFGYCKAGNQLPLFLLPNERVQIVLYWADSSDLKNRLAISKEDDAQVGATFSITKDKCKFVADYSFYSNSIMEKFRSEYSKGLTFAYTDYRLSKQSINQATALQNVRNIGGNGMIVDSVLHSIQLDDGGPLELTGRFSAEEPTALGGAGKTDRNLLTSNLFLNSQFLYPQSVSNSARHYHNLKESMGQVPYVSRATYSGEGQEALSGLDTGEFEGRTQDTELTGAFFFQGFRLAGTGQRVDNRGIDLHTDQALADVTHTQRAFLEIRRYVVISDGHLETFYT